MEMKLCKKCNENKDLNEFYVKNKSTGCRFTECKECRSNYHKSYYRNNLENFKEYYKKLDITDKRKAQIRNNHLNHKYGISLDDYENMFRLQGGLCKICQIPQSELKQNFAVDHCHKTGKIRGLLCKPCNQALGNFKDSVNLLESAINYLKITNNEI